MQVTIIRSDNTVIVNGQSASVDCSDVSPVIRAIQWNGKTGWIEFERQGDHFIANTKIVDFSPYAFLADRWRYAFAEQSAKVRSDRARSIEEEIARIDAKKQQQAEFEAMAAAAREQAEQTKLEKEAIAAKLAGLDARNKALTERIAVAEAKLKAMQTDG